jgi:large repetitive protein
MKQPSSSAPVQSRIRARLVRHAPIPLALEARLVFDGDASKGLAEAPLEAIVWAEPSPASPQEQDANPPTELPPAPAASSVREIAFVDTAVPDWQQLVAHMRPDVQVILIDPTRDGFAQMEAALVGYSELTAIHVISHGSEGALLLGSSHYHAENLDAHAASLTRIGQALHADGDILLYGCDIARGVDGALLLGRLAEFTSADVAGSSDLTGTSRVGGNWILEHATGEIESDLFLTAEGTAAYENWLTSVSLSGRSGWTPVMFGPNMDPVGDSQAGAADTDIVGGASHGSLYTGYDSRGTDNPADDLLLFRLRIDNPTGTNPATFNGVAIVGLDVNGDGRIDIFISVDGRNNTRAVRLMDPGTNLNISPSTTSTSPLPVGWLPNNGVYAFTPQNFSTVLVSATTDPHWNGTTDIGGDGKNDIFVSWAIPMADLALVLAKASPTDRNGNYGPRGATGIPGFNQDTTVRYVSFTQTQPGPINGDLNGVGRTYDKNASFADLGAFTAPMSASNPVPAGPGIVINEPIDDGILNAAESSNVTISGTSSFLPSRLLTLTITDGQNTVTATTTTATDGTWSISGLNLSGLNDGTLAVTATVDPDGDAGTENNVVGTASVLHDRTPPAVSIDQLLTTTAGRPTISGQSDLSDGSIVTITIDPDNNPATANLIYQVLVTGGLWSLDTSAVAPISGVMPAAGLTSFSRITATATDAAGNSASAVHLNLPTVNSLSTNSTAPTLTGTWTRLGGDALTIQVNGATYSLTPTGNTWSLNLATATPVSGSLQPLVAGQTYEVIATVTRSGTSVEDTSTGELTITSSPIITVGIDGGPTASGTDTTPVITGTSGNAGGFVIVQLNPGNDTDLSDAVTYSVATDSGGNWTLDTGTAPPIAGIAPSAGYIGTIGVIATDSTGTVSDQQVLTITAPAVAIGSIVSTATTDGFGVVNNSGAGASWLNMTEDNAVTISGTGTPSVVVNVVVTDVSGRRVETSTTVAGDGTWSVSGLNLSSLDNGVLHVTATIDGTNISHFDTSVTHDKNPYQIYLTTQSPFSRQQGVVTGITDLPAGTLLTVRILRADTNAEVFASSSVSVGSDGRFSFTPSSNVGNYEIRIEVRPTDATTARDPAGNITLGILSNAIATSSGNSSTATIAITALDGDNNDNLISVADVAGGVVIRGTTSLTSAALNTFTVTVTDSNGHQETATMLSNGASGWSASLSEAQVKNLANGTLVVRANVDSGGIVVSNTSFGAIDLDSPTLEISDDTPTVYATGAVTFTFTFSEPVTGFTLSDITVTGGTAGSLAGSGAVYTLVVTPTASTNGQISVVVADNTANGIDTGRGIIGDSATQAYDTTSAAAAPAVTIDTSALVNHHRPVVTGTTSLAAGAPIVILVDVDNDGTVDLTYNTIVQTGGTWSVDIAAAVPSAGQLPEEGLLSTARITARATNAFGISTTADGLNLPTVVAQETNDSTPTLSGGWTQIAGDTIEVVVNGVTYSVAAGNLSVTATSWSLTPVSPLADGTYEVAVNVTRQTGGSVSDLSTSELLIDTAASVAIAGGASQRTGDARPTFSGSSADIPAGSVLTLTLQLANGSTLTYKTVLGSDGSWTVNTAVASPFSGTMPAAGLSGPILVTATAVDAAGNIGVDAATFDVDVTPPVIALTFNGKTSNPTPWITGTTDLPPGSTITVQIDPNNDGNWSDAHTYTTTVLPGGFWEVQATTPLSGIVGVRASGTDDVGNNTTTPAKELEIVANAPEIAITAPLPSVGSDNVADAIEDDAIVILGSTAHLAPGTLVSVTITDGTLTITDTAVVQSDGSWSLAPLNLSSMAHGVITVSAVAVDTDGSAYSDFTTFDHDKSALIAIDSISEDTGAVGDFITKDDTVSIRGGATPHASVTVVIRDAQNQVVATFNLTADGSGQWSTAPTHSLAPGNYTIEASSSSSTVTQALQIVDATAPTLLSSTPADNAINASRDGDIVLTFSKNVQGGTGFIALYDQNGDMVENFNVATGVGDAGGSITFTGAIVTLNPHADLLVGTGYYLTIGVGAVTDSVGNAFAGFNDSTTLNFSTAAVDTTAPIVTASQSLNYAENQASGAVLGTVAATDNIGVTGFRFANGTTTSTDGFFSINASGQISLTAAGALAAANDFETSPNSFVQGVQARDAAGNWSTAVDVTLVVTDLDDTAPVITGPGGTTGASSAITINENQTTVTTFTANEAVTWSIVGGEDQAAFTINPTTGVLTFVTAPDFEIPTDGPSSGTNTYLVTVRATDGAGNTSAQTLTVTVADVDETVPDTTAPVITPSQSFNYSENQASGALLGTVAASDNIGVTGFRFANGTTTSTDGFFSINASGQISLTAAGALAAANDFETSPNSFVQGVQARDAAGNWSTAVDVILVVTDLDDTAPVITGPGGATGTSSAITVNENQTAVTTFTANEAVTWSIVGGTDAGAFDLSSTGVLTFKVAPDYEQPTDSNQNNTYFITVRATDAAGNTSEQTLTVTVADVDETIPDTTAPIITPSQSFYYAENRTAGTVLGTVAASDDTGVTSFRFANGTSTSTDGYFSINASGQISLTAAGALAAANDFETSPNSFVQGVQARDAAGNWSTAVNVTLVVTDLDETVPDTTAPIITPSQSFNYAENRTAGTVLGTVAASDDTGVTGFRFANGTSTSTDGYFSINASGQISLTAAGALAAANDFETSPNSFVHAVQARDAAGNWSTAVDVTLAVTDLDDTAPVITGPGGANGATSAITVNENQTAVTTFTANEVVTWSIVGGQDQAAFTINSTTGVLTFVTAPDFEAPTDGPASGSNTYLVIVRATDSSGLTSEQTLTVTIADVAEAPTASVIPAASVVMGSPLPSHVVPAFTDHEGRPLQYSASLSNGQPLPAWLTFDPATRTFTGTPPAGTAAETLTLLVTAHNGRASVTASFSLTILLPAAPTATTDLGSAREASGVANSTPGTDATGNVLNNDSGFEIRVTAAQAGDSLNGQAVAIAGTGSTTIPGQFGTLHLRADGSYTYLVNNAHPEVEALAEGQQLTDTFTYRVVDGAGQIASASLRVVIAGANDAPPPLPPTLPSVPPVAPPSPVVVLPPAVPTTPAVTVVAATPAAPVLVPTVTVDVLRPSDTSVSASGLLPTGWTVPPPAASAHAVFAAGVTYVPAEAPSLSLYRGVPDQFSPPNSIVQFTIPRDAFAHTQPSVQVTLLATLVDGTPLPDWLVFNRSTGTFEGVAPRDFRGELRIKVIAVDEQGLQAEAVFRFYIGEPTTSSSPASGLREQLQRLSYLSRRAHGLEISVDNT